MYTSESINLKSQVINNIMMQMAAYIDKAAVDILQRVLEEQFVFLNVEQITTMPATIDNSTEIPQICCDEYCKYPDRCWQFELKDICDGCKLAPLFEMLIK